MKKISTIIPNYNNLSWLPKTLDSVLSQEGEFEQEIIIVDDHSTDSSWALLESYRQRFPDMVFIYKNKDKGGNNARNFGFKKSTGDFIQWLDSDDQLLPGKFKTQISYLVSHQDIDVVYSDWKMAFYNGKTEVREKIIKEKYYISFLKELIIDNWRAPLCYMLKRNLAETLDEINAWNPKREVAQDREYFTLAAINGANFGYVPGVFSVYNRWSNESVSAMNFKRRLKLSLELEEFFMMEIQKQDWINEHEKKQLISFLKTDSLKACFYDPSLCIKKKVHFKEIQWKRIHYKMRPIIPFIWLWQNLKLKFGNNS